MLNNKYIMNNVLKKKLTKLFITLTIILTIILAIFIAISSVNAANITVNPTDDLSAAIEYANTNNNPSNIITLNPGIYNKDSDRNIIITNKNNQLSSKNTIIRGNGSRENIIIDTKNLGRLFNNTKNSNVTFINITFANARISGSGGAIYNDGMLTLINCTFINNTVNSFGGAIYNTGDNMIITGCVFENNSNSGSNGGAIFSQGNYTFISNSKFINNKAYNYGGAIFINSHSNNFKIDNCTFINNTAEDREGGAVYNLANDYLTITNSEFINNSAKTSGGALYNTGGDYFTITNCTFKFNSNEGGFGGGAIGNTYQNADGLPGGDYFGVINCTFINNTDGLAGGAISNHYACNVHVVNSTFINNSAYLHGGAIYNLIGPNFTVVNSIFMGNMVENGYGGAIENMDAQIFSVINSTFTNNYASIDGGAIYNNNNYYPDYWDVVTIMEIINSTFNDNFAVNQGGAVYNGAIMLVKGNIMSGNDAGLGKEYYNNGSMGVLNLTYLGNSTVRVDNNTYVSLFTVLTDDMGNTVTGQNISFFVNGTFIGNITAIEGYANITHLVTHGRGIVSVTGDYAGHDGFDIVIRDGQLLIITETTVNGNISFDKDEYFVNETANLKVNITNNGLDKAYNVTVKVNLPKDFILNKNNVVVSHGYYDFGTNTWFIGDLEVDEEAIMTFTGYFTKIGNYTADIITNGSNFNTTTDIDNTEVKHNTTPTPTPIPTPIDEDDEDDPNIINDNPTPKAAMKPTGIPIIAIILVLLSSLGLFVRKK